MSVSLLGLVALVSLISVLAYRYRAGRHHPSSRPDDSDSNAAPVVGVPAVSVYGEECPAVRTAGNAIYVTGDGVILMEGDTIRLDGRSVTVTELRRTNGGPGDGVLIVGLSEIP